MSYEYDYERPSVTVDMVVFGLADKKVNDPKKNAEKELNILLVRRDVEPYRGMFALPGGFLRRNETVTWAADRELLEETGLCHTKLINLGVYSESGRDPRGWIISNAFIALVKSELVCPDYNADVDIANWFPFKYKKEGTSEVITIGGDESTSKIGGKVLKFEIRVNNGEFEPSELPFDHAKIIYDAFKKLQDEVKYHDIAFDLMPELFAISDLHWPYKLIVNDNLTPEGFRRKMMSKIEETDQYSKQMAHRPTKLYRRKAVSE